jgi:type VI secretion system secreted protein Hcp
MTNQNSKFRRPLLQGALAAAATAMIAAPSPAPAATFLKLGDIVGESVDAKHKGQIDILTFTQSWTNDLNLGSGEGGAGAGKVQCGAVMLMKNIDKTSPLLLKSVATGVQHESAVIAFQGGIDASGRAAMAGAAADYYTITMGTVFVTELSQTDEKDPNRVFEKLVLKAQTYEFKYQPLNAKGAALGSPVSFKWDCALNTGG